MAPESPARRRWPRLLAVVLAVVVPALLTWLFWRTTPPVGGYALAPGGETSSPGTAPALYAPATLDPAALYAQNCASCHGASLEGTPRGVALRRPSWPYAQNGAALVRLIHEGRGLTMPSFRGRLSQQQIEALATYLQDANRAPAP